MNDIEELYRSHRKELDRLEPKDTAWESIQSRLPRSDGHHPWKNRTGGFKAYWRIAAGVAVLFGLFSILPVDPVVESSEVYSALVEACENESLRMPTGEAADFDPSMNRYTLVQFWASGNVICVEENCHYYLPAYERYKDQGFEIVAVSVDSDAAEWVASIEEHKLPWVHMSDLKGLDSPICIECNITQVPASYLLDQNGALLAKNLDAEELEVTLAGLFVESH